MQTIEKNQRFITTATLEAIAGAVQVTQGAAMVMADGQKLPLSAPMVCSMATALLHSRAQQKANEAAPRQSTGRLEGMINDLERARDTVVQPAGASAWHVGSVVDFLRELLVFRRQQAAPREIQVVIEGARGETARDTALEQRLANVEDAVRRVVDQVQVVVGVLALQEQATASRRLCQQPSYELVPRVGDVWRERKADGSLGRRWRIEAVLPLGLAVTEVDTGYVGRIEARYCTSNHYQNCGNGQSPSDTTAPAPDATGHP